jgi:hypothetical protein
MDGARPHIERDPIDNRDRLRAWRRIVWWKDGGGRFRVYQGQDGDQGKSSIPSEGRGQPRCALTTGVADGQARADRQLTWVYTRRERRRGAGRLDMGQHEN